ncbi:669_t:CDS:2 [Acaulospora colombiana]|uniref:669_t:CDS:1 n=1 Tax=Acaulospora colombiana TaxID=27376 RepID=A0ACA9NZL9_9GLOM|nr:669_t:CDS:2 [Acaulospora colombiana]
MSSSVYSLRRGGQQILDTTKMGQTSSAASEVNTSPVNQQPPARCPVDHSAMQKTTAQPPAECPVKHDVNPRNQMPTLEQHPISSNQAASLSTERVSSTIPRDSQATWDYPSPQQFYNALVRKGWETPEEHIDTMVDIHNFLNEQAWEEVLKWEKRIDNSEPPFDRHDWIVRRKTGEEVRYVIDYYSLPDQPDGTPVFSLDVRPALDSVSSIKERISVAAEEGWAKIRQNPEVTTR